MLRLGFTFVRSRRMCKFSGACVATQAFRCCGIRAIKLWEKTVMITKRRQQAPRKHEERCQKRLVNGALGCRIEELAGNGAGAVKLIARGQTCSRKCGLYKQINSFRRRRANHLQVGAKTVTKFSS